MTIAEAISLVITRVAGARPSTEVDVHPASVRKYLAAASSEAFARELRQRSVDKKRSFRGYRIISDPAFYQDRVFDVDRTQPGMYPSAVVDPTPVEVSYMAWIDGAYPEIEGPMPVSADAGFRLLNTQSELRSTDRDMLGDVVFTFYSRGRMYFVGLPYQVKQVRLRYAPSVDGLADGDELPVPANLEAQILDRAAEYFLNARLTPAERLEDGRDEVKTTAG